jgi:hypothetical protein
MCCALFKTAKGNPFEFPLTANFYITTVILSFVGVSPFLATFSAAGIRQFLMAFCGKNTAVPDGFLRQGCRSS